jgi:hypothetical protein
MFMSVFVRTSFQFKSRIGIAEILHTFLWCPFYFSKKLLYSSVYMDMFINLNSRHFRHKWVCHQFRNGLYGNNRMPEISVNHTDLGTAILRCPFPEIRDIIWIWVQPNLATNNNTFGDTGVPLDCFDDI